MTKETKNAVKPTTILSGFLGAGKTTYLNHLLESKPNTRFAIIENEFGEESIDSELIIRAEDGIVELNNGCLCCTLNDNLYDILNTLFERRDEYDEIIIEATGVADPRGLAEPFIIHPAIKKQFPLKGIICLVDAELVEDQIQETEEAIHQITFSDILLVNKTDLVDNAYLNSLSQKLAQMNPLASMFFGHQNDFPSIDITNRNTDLDKPLEKQHSHSHGHHDNSHNHSSAHFPVHQPHHHHDHEHTDVVSIMITFDQPFNPQTLRHVLTVYLTLQARDLYRMKGLLWFKDADEQYLLQSVGKRHSIDVKRLWEAGEKRESKIVFIGKNLQRKGLERMLKQCLAK